VIAGEDRLTTVHRENGILLHLDLAQVYFSVRSAHERARIAAQVKPGETVAVLCSGVGPFPLIIGPAQQGARGDRH
jgi:tRNA (guanine37-N1)-methyltransferase